MSTPDPKQSSSISSIVIWLEQLARNIWETRETSRISEDLLSKLQTWNDMLNHVLVLARTMRDNNRPPQNPAEALLVTLDYGEERSWPKDVREALARVLREVRFVSRWFHGPYATTRTNTATGENAATVYLIHKWPKIFYGAKVNGRLLREDFSSEREAMDACDRELQKGDWTFLDGASDLEVPEDKQATEPGRAIETRIAPRRVTLSISPRGPISVRHSWSPRQICRRCGMTRRPLGETTSRPRHYEYISATGENRGTRPGSCLGRLARGAV